MNFADDCSGGSELSLGFLECRRRPQPSADVVSPFCGDSAVVASSACDADTNIAHLRPPVLHPILMVLIWVHPHPRFSPVCCCSNGLFPLFPLPLPRLQAQDGAGCTAYMHSGCKLNRRELGRAAWGYLHTMAAYYPERPTPRQQENMRTYLELTVRSQSCFAIARVFCCGLSCLA